MILYDEPAETYHANPAIGSGKARDLLRSPLLCAPGAPAKRRTPALLFGVGSHLKLLEPELFASSVALKPAKMSFATTEGKKWRDEQVGKLIVTDKDAEHLARMHASMPLEVREIFAKSRKEVTVRTALQGLPVQCRVDLWSPAPDTLYDLKTIPKIEDCERQIYRFGYHIQERWYVRVVEAETGKRLPFRFVFVEKDAPYRWRIVELDLDYRAIGDRAVDDALHGFIARNKSGCWDDPEDLHLLASPPSWMEIQDADTEEEDAA